MIAPTILFRGVETSQALRSNIRDHAQRLEQIAGEARECRVVVSLDGGHHKHGNLYRVNIQLAIGTHRIEAGDLPSHDPRHEDPYVTVADAFDALRRQIEDHVQRERG